jgi:nickel superoxide dismutase
MGLADNLVRLVDRVSPPQIADAHCDIPCGIYDPHQAQIAALTVIRMLQLMQNLEAPGADATKEQRDAYLSSLSRYVAVKEEHAKLVEHEIIILWTDYFRPEHVEKHSNLHDLVWRTAKLTSTVKQQNNAQAAQELLTGVQEIAEIFWDTKGVKTRRQPSNQTAGGELVYPTT